MKSAELTQQAIVMYTARLAGGGNNYTIRTQLRLLGNKILNELTKASDVRDYVN